jgi:hypothetical protein
MKQIKYQDPKIFVISFSIRVNPFLEFALFILMIYVLGINRIPPQLRFQLAYWQEYELQRRLFNI